MRVVENRALGCAYRVREWLEGDGAEVEGEAFEGRATGGLSFTDA